jgi:hypothetical protein
MNVITLIGAAAVCEAFCDLLFNDPVRAAQLLGLVLTQGDLATLKKMFNKKNRDEVCGHFSELQTLICHHPPCTAAPVIAGFEDLCSELSQSTQRRKASASHRRSRR